MRFTVDPSWRRFGAVTLAGSPLRIFRTTTAGTDVVTRIERGEDVTPSRLIERLLDAGAIHPCPPGSRPMGATTDHVTVVTPQLGPLRPTTDGVPLHPFPKDTSSTGESTKNHDGSRGPVQRDIDVHDDGRVTIDDGSEPPLRGADHRLDTNRGPAAARNASRPLVDTAFVAFLDADVSVPDGHATWIDPLLWHFDDPRVALIAPRVTGEHGSPLDLGDTAARIRSGTRVSYVPGAALIVRVAALDAIGWFDEGLRFGEDVDLVWRLDEAGWRCRYDPDVSVWHTPRRTLPARLRQHAGYGTSAAPLAARHPGALSPLHANGATLLTWASWLSGHVIVGAATAVGSAFMLERKLPDLPRSASFGLAMRGHLLAGQQIAAAIRRVWWPIVAIGAIVSRRFRWIALLAVAADARATPTDVAYGWGVWKGMWRHRTWAPIVPVISSWPPRRRPAPSRFT